MRSSGGLLIQENFTLNWHEATRGSFNPRKLIFKCQENEILHSTLKELSLCHKLWFSNPYIYATQCWRPYLFQTMISVISNSLSLNYQGFTQSSCKNNMIRNFNLWQRLIFLYFFTLMHEYFFWVRSKDWALAKLS